MTGVWPQAKGAAVASFRLRQNRRTLLLGAPCFSRGSWTLSPAEKRSLLKLALAAGFAETSAKAQDQSRNFFRSAKALLPPHKCGGAPPEGHSPGFVQHSFLIGKRGGLGKGGGLGG